MAAVPGTHESGYNAEPRYAGRATERTTGYGASSGYGAEPCYGAASGYGADQSAQGRRR